MRRILSRLLPAAAVSLAILWATGEVSLRLSRPDLELLPALLKTASCDPDVHIPIRDPERLFGLRPGDFQETGGRVVRVNSLGFRDRDRTGQKPDGVFRILALGGCQVYGASVGNDETWPARLEEILNSRYGGGFEVWNLADCPFVLAQTAALALEVVNRFDADLVLFGPSEPGRRSFDSASDIDWFFYWNPLLFWENLGILPLPKTAWAAALMRHSLLTRTTILALNTADAETTNPWFDSDEANIDAFLAFWHGCSAKAKTAFVDAMPDRFNGSDIRVPELRIRRTERLPAGADASWLATNPGPAAFTWFAEAVAEDLAAMRFLPEDRIAAASNRSR